MDKHALSPSTSLVVSLHKEAIGSTGSGESHTDPRGPGRPGIVPAAIGPLIDAGTVRRVFLISVIHDRANANCAVHRLAGLEVCIPPKTQDTNKLRTRARFVRKPLNLPGLTRGSECFVVKIEAGSELNLSNGELCGGIVTNSHGVSASNESKRANGNNKDEAVEDALQDGLTLLRTLSNGQGERQLSHVLFIRVRLVCIFALLFHDEQVALV